MLEVGINGSLLGLGILEQDGGNAIGLGSSLAMHGLVEGGIALLVLPLELNWLAHLDALRRINN